MSRLIAADRLKEVVHRNTVGDLFDEFVDMQPTVQAIPLDKIKEARAQIIDEKDFAYADFEKYKVECLEQDWEDVHDSLPQDDFRYGMERCLNILDKLIAESKGQQMITRAKDGALDI